MSLQVLFCFHFPHFYFASSFLVVEKSASPPSRTAVLWCYILKGHKQRTLSLEGVTLKDTNLLFGSVSTSAIPSRPRWSRKSIPFVWLSPGEKKMELNQLLLVWCVWSRLIWVSVKTLMTFFGFCKIQDPDHA